MRLRSGGIDVDLPAGWEARIYRTAVSGDLAKRGDGTARPNPAILHAATFALPEGRGDYGSGAVELMGPGDVFVSVLDMGPEAAGTPLFALEGLPRTLEPERFGPDTLQRALPGQAGTQVFFSSGGRAFVLYVVLGSSARRVELAARATALLAGLRLEPADAAGGGAA